jgi:hypothetical protein
MKLNRSGIEEKRHGSGKGKLQNELGHVPPIQLDSSFARFNWVGRQYDRVDVVVGRLGSITGAPYPRVV